MNFGLGLVIVLIIVIVFYIYKHKNKISARMKKFRKPDDDNSDEESSLGIENEDLADYINGLKHESNEG
jgi:predicted PurR-regulated permease PerM